MRIFFVLVLVFLSSCTTPEKKQYKTCSLQDFASGHACVDPDEAEVSKHPLGSFDNPVRAAGPSGQHDYLSRLICEGNENPVEFTRVGSVGTGPYGFIVDRYSVVCNSPSGPVEHDVYMDMYHGGYVEERPAEGFISIEPGTI